MVAKLRVARPTDNLPERLCFCRDAPGPEELASLPNHSGFDGVILGYSQAPYPLEFTHQPGHMVGRAPTADPLLVFYLPHLTAWQAAVQRIHTAGSTPVPSYNPYWDQPGLTFEDPDAYWVVLQPAAWQLWFLLIILCTLLRTNAS